jgi:bacterioferritin
MPRVTKTTGRAVEALQAALDAEMSGVAMYTHLAFRVFGPQMQGIVMHLRGQAAESLQHAQLCGDRMTMLGALPQVRVAQEVEHSPTSLDEILRVSLVHERRAVECYRNVLAAAGDDIPLEEFARGMVATETDHAAELEKMLRPRG